MRIYGSEHLMSKKLFIDLVGNHSPFRNEKETGAELTFAKISGKDI